MLKFGTSGLRGLVAEMTDPVSAAWTAAFLTHLGTGGAPAAVLVGRDLRPSSPRIAAACRGAIRDAGFTAIDCGVVPTPALALEAARRGLPAIMVTGSHIPFDRNGLKFYRAGDEITKADEDGIRAAFSRPHPTTGAGTEQAAEIGSAYVARNVDFFGAGVLAGKRVGLWQHSAAGRDLTRAMLEALGAEVVALGRTDDFVPIDTEALAPADAARIADWIAAHRLDALVSTDGDGDRPLVADETGAVLRGDALGALAGHALGADAVACPLNASTALERSGWFDRTVRTRIGSPYVVAAIAELAGAGARLPVGYEANGGFLLGGDAGGPDGRVLAALPTRDALAPIVSVLAAAARTGRPLSALVADLPQRITASDRLPDFPDTASGPLLAALATDAAARSRLLDGLGAVAAIDTRDGVRMTLDSGDVVHLRASGNAPELRCYAEAATAGTAAHLIALVLGRVAAGLSRAA
ncbi:MAG: phosphomannomutase [Amaricoccus sp.]|uniref:phosphomannomutase n=1 Tax=Amaricoccus sp. TaxID=1872485 RepID=UPI0039E3AE66